MHSSNGELFLMAKLDIAAVNIVSESALLLISTNAFSEVVDEWKSISECKYYRHAIFRLHLS